MDREPPRPHLGLMRDEQVVDVDLAGRALQVPVPDQMQDLIDNYETYQASLQAILEKAGPRRFSEVRTYREAGAAHALRDVTLAAPIPRPRKNIFCLGVNYSEHAEESARAHGRVADMCLHSKEREALAPRGAFLNAYGYETLAYPLIFTKAPTSVNSPYGEIVIDPGVSTEIDWEVELAIIIGKGGKNIREEDAMSHVFGYTVLNDITARDLQSRHKQYFKGKSLDGACPMGPWIVTADEIPDPHALALCLRVNGVTKQDGNTSQMIFSIPQTIASLSLGMTLEPGDIISTGTPSGVGFSRVPPEFLRPGDIVEAEVKGIGLLRNPVVGIA